MFFKKHKFAQASVEFFIYSSLFALFATLAIFSFLFFFPNEFKRNEDLYTYEVGNKIATQIFLISNIPHNFNYTLDFPTTILGKPYSLFIKSAENKSFLYIVKNDGNTTYIFSLPHITRAEGNCIIKKKDFYEINVSKGFFSVYRNLSEFYIIQNNCIKR